MINLQADIPHRTRQPIDARPESRRYCALSWTLRVLGAIDLVALVAVLMPEDWMRLGHSLAGLGQLPDAPIVGYLARSTSALYALHGLLVLYMSFDVQRYWGLVRFFAAAAVIHGLVMLGIDLHEGMPPWWTLVEGPTFAATGGIVLMIQTGSRGDVSNAGTRGPMMQA